MPETTTAARLQAIWYRHEPPPLALRLCAGLFGLVVRLRRAAYARGLLRVRRLARPVVIVGNLTVGGSGKTPLVIWLAGQLRLLGLRPGVILRGYGGSAEHHRSALVVEPDSDPGVVGDEALLLRLRTGGPVVVCRDRVRAGERLLAEGVDVILADDGLQHLRLARDVEIAVLDGERVLGNGYLLPAGPLREPASRLAAVDAVVVHGGATTLEAETRFRMTLEGQQLLSLGREAPIALATLAGREVHAMAGIGHPERFFAQLTAAGLHVIGHAFPDHHRYRAEDLSFADNRPLLMTEKDAVKCRAFAAPGRWYLPVEAHFEARQAVALMTRLRARLTPSGR